MIKVDDREVKSGICDELTKLNIPLNVERLDIGDYIINENIFIERKTTMDFIESLKDRRLFDQVARLRNGNKRAIMIIEGARLSGNKSIRGALCSISAQWYMPILRSVNLEGTAWILNQMYSCSMFGSESKHSYEFRTKKGIASMQERMLMQMRQVGPDLARKLVRKFDSIYNIINASDEELMEVKGIGKQLIQQIRLLK